MADEVRLIQMIARNSTSNNLTDGLLPQYAARIQNHRQKLMKTVKRNSKAGIRSPMEQKAQHELDLGSHELRMDGKSQDIADVTESFSEDRVALFLSHAGFRRYHKKFLAAHVDGAAMIQLDDAGLVALGMDRPGDREQFLGLLEFILQNRNRETAKGGGEIESW
jgi:hypothetical protein